MIRFASAADFPTVRRLWETCFPDEGGFNAYFFAKFFSLSAVLLEEEQGEICAMVQMLPYRLRLADGEGEVTYIYGACTDPQHRRRGHMARLLERSFALDREHGRVASMLIPAEAWLFDFYKPFGYDPFFTVDKHIVRRTVGGEGPRRLTADDLPEAAALYERLTPPCHVLRDAADWRAQLALFDEIGAGAYGWFAGETLAAYAFCWQDGAQEALGLTETQEQGLLQTLGLEELRYSTCGGETALGCIKWHGAAAAQSGYMNLMLN